MKVQEMYVIRNTSEMELYGYLTDKELAKFSSIEYAELFDSKVEAEKTAGKINGEFLFVAETLEDAIQREKDYAFDRGRDNDF